MGLVACAASPSFGHHEILRSEIPPVAVAMPHLTMIQSAKVFERGNQANDHEVVFGFTGHPGLEAEIEIPSSVVGLDPQAATWQEFEQLKNVGTVELCLDTYLYNPDESVMAGVASGTIEDHVRVKSNCHSGLHLIWMEVPALPGSLYASQTTPPSEKGIVPALADTASGGQPYRYPHASGAAH